MHLAYTVKSGILKSFDSEFPFSFALIFLDEGVYYVHVFLIDNKFIDKKLGTGYFSINGITEKNYNIEVQALFCSRFSSSKSKLEFICDGYIKLTDNRKKEAEENHIPDDIYFVELEGLKMEFSNYTTTEEYRFSGKVDNFFNFKFDHTSCAMIVNHPEILGNYYKLIFTKNAENENLLIDFTHHKGYNRLSFDSYLKVKTGLLSFLSFINGGPVYVRRELTGYYLLSAANSSKDSQIVYNYSNKIVSNVSLNDYLPINEHHSFSSEIIPHMFISCFEKFFSLSQTLDFNSLINSLNHSFVTPGIEERHYILITALEKIASAYLKSSGQRQPQVINENYFINNLKPDLMGILKKHENSIKQNSTAAFQTFASKIGNLNNRDKTSKKIYALLEYAYIPLTDKVIDLVENERNWSVHEGKIGDTNQQRLENYWKLDHILRDIVLNLIGYKKIRKRKIDYDR